MRAVYFGSSESLGSWRVWGERLEMRLGRQLGARLGRALSARLRSFRFTMWRARFECLAEYTYLILTAAHRDLTFNVVQITQLANARTEILAPDLVFLATTLFCHADLVSFSLSLRFLFLFYIVQNSILF